MKGLGVAQGNKPAIFLQPVENNTDQHYNKCDKFHLQSTCFALGNKIQKFGSALINVATGT